MAARGFHAFRPSRRRGQHFLVDRGIQRRIAQAAQLPQGAVVLELGAGTGLLTDALRFYASRVIAVEIEPVLVARLEAKFEQASDVVVLSADARDIDVSGIGTPCYHVVANLPFSAGTRMVINLLQSTTPPQSMSVVLQREVVQRMCAPLGSMRLLAVIVQSVASASPLFDVPPGAFRPRPKVVSTLVRLESLKLDTHHRNRVFRRVAAARQGFAQPRKQLRNSLGGFDGIAQRLADCGIDPKRRPESLSLDEWDLVADVIDDGAACRQAAS